jgi:hypothetical protein
MVDNDYCALRRQSPEDHTEYETSAGDPTTVVDPVIVAVVAGVAVVAAVVLAVVLTIVLAPVLAVVLAPVITFVLTPVILSPLSAIMFPLGGTMANGLCFGRQGQHQHRTGD